MTSPNFGKKQKFCPLSVMPSHIPIVSLFLNNFYFCLIAGIYSAEFVMSSILKQKIDFDSAIYESSIDNLR